MRRLFCLTTVLAMVPFTLNTPAFALGPEQEQLDTSVEKGVAYLKSTQLDDGSWTSPTQPGITGLVLYGLAVSEVPADDSVMAKGLKHLESHIQPDGGIYYEKSTHKNYETAISLMALQAADPDGRYQETIAKAAEFLKNLQWDEDEVGDKSDPAYGGSGYGGHSRPDLSNTTFFLEAMRAAGVSSSDPAIEKALVFVSRCQNLESKYNDTEFADKVNDGGFYYTPAAGGTSQAGQTPNGGLRSYASMTYAGLKSMIYAGLTPEDPRVKAATDWIRKFYTLEENPGMGQQGLFYYYQTFAKALDTLGVDEFEEASGIKHDWRRELAEHLFSIQREDGSWVNPAERWLEGNPELVTAYTLMALNHCEPQN